jgi:tetratricopeptide (TPR) repeat protein
VFSPDGSRIAASGRDGVLRLYDARTGQQALALKAPALLEGPVFSPDGSRIAAAGSDGVVRVYDAPNDTTTWQAQRRQAVADGLSTWHRARAAEGEPAGQWFAAAFHWGWLARAGPAGGQNQFRRGVALAHLGQAAEARKVLEAALARKQDLADLDQAEAHAILGRWDEAGALFEKAAAAPNASDLAWYRYGLSRLQQGDREGYRRACSGMIRRFGKPARGRFTNNVAWTCALAPEALADLKPAVDLARFAVRVQATSAALRNTLGAILHRSGQHKEAIAELNAAIQLDPGGGGPADFLFLALAHHALGKPDEARKWLERARQALQKSPPAYWTDQVELRLLRREAEDLIR